MKKWIENEKLQDFSQRIGEGRVWQHSAFIAYYTAVSVFPLIVGLLNAFSYYQIAPEPLTNLIQRILPGVFATWIAEDMQQIYEASNVGILVVAGVTTVWTVSWCMAAIQMGLNGAYGVAHRKNLVVLRIIAFLLTFVFAGAGVILFVGISALGMNGTGERIAVLLAVGILFAMLYYLVPNVQQKWRDVLPGTLFSMFIFFLASIVYSLFLGVIPETSTFFTTLGAFTFLMVLLQLFTMMVLIGAVMNAVVQRSKYGHVTEKNDNSKFLRTWDAFWGRVKE